MPELAEVYFFGSKWDVGIGKKVRSVELHSKARIYRDTQSSKISKALPNSVYRGSRFHGKQMLAEFSEGKARHWLWIQLGMTGKLHAQASDYHAEKHDHLVIRQSKTTLVFTDPRMFGRVRYFHTTDKHPPKDWQALPHDLLSKSFNKAHFKTILERRPKTNLKALLLDQAYFPGIGNWMADEILWQAKLHPSRRVNSLTEKEATTLYKKSVSISKTAMKIIAPNWGKLPNSWLFNHRWKAGNDCPSCGKELARETVAGRTSSFCLNCQKRN